MVTDNLLEYANHCWLDENNAPIIQAFLHEHLGAEKEELSKFMQGKRQVFEGTTERMLSLSVTQTMGQMLDYEFARKLPEDNGTDVSEGETPEPPAE